MHKMRVKAKMGVRDKDMKKRAKGLEIGKGGRYAMPFYERHAPCGAANQFDQTFSKFDAKQFDQTFSKFDAKQFDQTFSKFDAKQFDQTFSKFDAWCESMEGLQSAEMRGAMT